MKVAGKIWANSGDSHINEPPDLFDGLPEHLKGLMPRSVKDPSGAFETIYVDGQSFERAMPQLKPDADGKIPAGRRPSAMPSCRIEASGRRRRRGGRRCCHRAGLRPWPRR